MADLCEGYNATSGSLKAIYMPMERGHYSEKYSKVDLWAAVGTVLKDRWSTYRASKKYNVPFNNLKRFLYAFSGPDDFVIPKKGRPLALTVEEEQKLVTYWSAQLYEIRAEPS
ncbi:hypothetical protein ANN_01688 [Periplaneta americana]|uniref:HTH psq-type domain-containing protein n=1 Tax=Periplaneta americana TaxID=6978 RepID=A0ABQ8TUD0_PERAM|nr:hypothetical protein ANN_01688 [Periplaneta americana]